MNFLSRISSSILRFFVFTYIIAAAALAIYSAFTQTQPALSVIHFLLSNDGTFPLKMTILLSFLMLMIPLVTILIIVFAVKKIFLSAIPQNVDPAATGIWITRKNQLFNFLIPSPIFINGNKMGTIGSGQTVFYKIEPGSIVLQAGGKQTATSEISAELKSREQLKFEMGYNQNNVYINRVN